MKLLADRIKTTSGPQTHCVSDANKSLHPSTEPRDHLALQQHTRLKRQLLEMILTGLIFLHTSWAGESCFAQRFKVML